ncbi:hypothetical protein OAO87_01045 [bacterium]|nr:hypothetical protein [bacterium]
MCGGRSKSVGNVVDDDGYYQTASASGAAPQRATHVLGAVDEALPHVSQA